MGETILELQNIAKHFGDTDVLNGISISIGKGEFITLLGLAQSSALLLDQRLFLQISGKIGRAHV